MKIELVKETRPDRTVVYYVTVDDKVTHLVPIDGGTIAEPKAGAFNEASIRYGMIKYAALNPEPIVEIMRSEEI